MLWIPRTGIKNHCFGGSKIMSWCGLLTWKSKMWIINWRHLLPLCSWAIHNHNKQAAPVELSLLVVSFRIKHVCWMSSNEMCSLFSIDGKCLWERKGMTHCKKKKKKHTELLTGQVVKVYYFTSIFSQVFLLLGTYR